MELHELKLESLGIRISEYGRIFTFVDYGNVNYWYDKDRRDADDKELPIDRKLFVDIEKLAQFANLFSTQKRFYYGWNPRNKKNWHIAIKAERCGFIKNTKPMQFIKHFMDNAEISEADSSQVRFNETGYYIEIPKSNFDVEISVDAIRKMDEFDTFCIFSGDGDFTYLARFLKRQGKKIIVIASGQVFHTLKDLADLYINAQHIKGSITSVKTIVIKTTPSEGRSLDIGSASGGQGDLRLTANIPH